jgi:hypothetical protein
VPNPFSEPTRAVRDEELLAALRAAPGPGQILPDEQRRFGSGEAYDEATVGVDPNYAEKLLGSSQDSGGTNFDDEATRLAPANSLDRATDERTRSVDIRDREISDIDWDID